MTGISNGTGFYGQMKLVQIHGIMDSIKYQKIKKTKPDRFCWKSYNGAWLDLPSGQ